jgi:hypothetical protein
MAPIERQWHTRQKVLAEAQTRLSKARQQAQEWQSMAISVARASAQVIRDPTGWLSKFAEQSAQIIWQEFPRAIYLESWHLGGCILCLA